MKKIYEKYNVEDYAGLLQHFEMITLTPFEDLAIDDEGLYHSLELILDRAKQSKYNPFEESIMIKTTFLTAVYGFDGEEFSDMIKAMGVFRAHLFLKDVLTENLYYNEYYNLYLERLNRLNNVGIILIQEGRDLLDRVDGWLSNLSIDGLQDLMKNFEAKAKELGIFEELEKINN